ncbi:hypothetical protein ACQJBY_042881 [Aegilops geniculata]
MMLTSSGPCSAASSLTTSCSARSSSTTSFMGASSLTHPLTIFACASKSSPMSSVISVRPSATSSSPAVSTLTAGLNEEFGNAASNLTLIPEPTFTKMVAYLKLEERRMKMARTRATHTALIASTRGGPAPSAPALQPPLAANDRRRGGHKQQQPQPDGAQGGVLCQPAPYYAGQTHGLGLSDGILGAQPPSHQAFYVTPPPYAAPYEPLYYGQPPQPGGLPLLPLTTPPPSPMPTLPLRHGTRPCWWLCTLLLPWPTTPGVVTGILTPELRLTWLPTQVTSTPPIPSILPLASPSGTVSLFLLLT